jgi:hypothetical protein
MLDLFSQILRYTQEKNFSCIKPDKINLLGIKYLVILTNYLNLCKEKFREGSLD